MLRRILSEDSAISSVYSVLDHRETFLVVNKAPGIAVQGDAGTASLLQVLKQDLSLPELYPVHRLDQGTSGVLVLAKTAAANRQLSLGFQGRQVRKFYLAITAKKPVKKQGWVIGDMEKSRGGSYKLCHTRENPARTAFFSFAFEEAMRLLILRPVTGKTHQLRVALKALAAPIIGDVRYGGISADRMYLHAWHLDFILDGQRFSYRAPPVSGELFTRPSFGARLEALGEPDRLPWSD
jgi:tRNA pseudouridine32 synthase / 23S rRNA pseudouridine746 synthase